MCSDLFSFHITLVRHGETSGNRAAVLQGQIEVPLNERGRKQAELLANHFEQHLLDDFDLVFTSNLGRAVETCRIVNRRHLDRIQIEPLLIERGFGLSEGRPLVDFYSQAKKAGFIENMSQYTPEGGERLEEVNERIRKFCKTILLAQVRPHQRVLVVAHGAVIREFHRFFRHDLRVDMNGLEPLKITPNTGVNEFRLVINKGKLAGGECVRMHDIQHLIGFDFSTIADDAKFDRTQCIKTKNQLLMSKNL